MAEPAPAAEQADPADMAAWAAENAAEPVADGGEGAADDWDAGAATAVSERILNQDEIDSLLGFELSDNEDGERTGIRAIINSALVSYERLPMLEIVFD